MTEPTITQSGALYLAQHRAKNSRANRRRLLTARMDRLRDLRTRMFGEVIDMRRLHLGRQ